LRYFIQTCGITPLGVFSYALIPRPQDAGSPSNSTHRTCHLGGHPSNSYPGPTLFDFSDQMSNVAQDDSACFCRHRNFFAKRVERALYVLHLEMSVCMQQRRRRRAFGAATQGFVSVFLRQLADLGKNNRKHNSLCEALFTRIPSPLNRSNRGKLRRNKLRGRSHESREGRKTPFPSDGGSVMTFLYC
jgi:hypothetical protein